MSSRRERKEKDLEFHSAPPVLAWIGNSCMDRQGRLDIPLENQSTCTFVLSQLRVVLPLLQCDRSSRASVRIDLPGGPTSQHHDKCDKTS